MATPFILYHLGAKETRRKDGIRIKKEELEGLREYVYTYISPFVDTSELKKYFKISIVKVESIFSAALKGTGVEKAIKEQIEHLK